MAKRKKIEDESGIDLSNTPAGAAVDDGSGICVGITPLAFVDDRPIPAETERQQKLADSTERAEREAAQYRALDEGDTLGVPVANPAPAPAAAPVPTVQPAARRDARPTGTNGVIDKPRAVFYVINKDVDDVYTDVLSIHKTKRRAERWMRENAPMIRRYCAHVKVFRAKEA